MRVCLEATSLLGSRSGVGHLTASLAQELVRVDEEIELVLLPITVRGAGRLTRVAPKHARISSLRTRIPARAIGRVWARFGWPPAELFSGAVDVFHGPNFVLPPLLKAAGVLSVHDLSFERMPEACSPHVRTYSRTVPPAAERAARILVLSHAVERELATWIPDTRERIRVVPPGVREPFLASGGPLTPPRREVLGIRDPYVIYVGNLERRKNIGLLFEAFEHVRDKFPDVQLVLVGAPSVGWSEIVEEHAELVASDAVRLPGYLPDGEVAALVRGARAFVWPSRYEGFGIPPLEAMACSTPVIAGDIPVLREALAEHATFVDVDDVGPLVEAIAAHLEGTTDADRLESARAHATRYTWERHARRTLDVYREAVREKSS